MVKKGREGRERKKRGRFGSMMEKSYLGSAQTRQVRKNTRQSTYPKGAPETGLFQWSCVSSVVASGEKQSEKTTTRGKGGDLLKQDLALVQRKRTGKKEILNGKIRGVEKGGKGGGGRGRQKIKGPNWRPKKEIL